MFRRTVLSVCAAKESSGTGLGRNVDPHPRSEFGSIWWPYDGTRGLQDPGSGCLSLSISLPFVRRLGRAKKKMWYRRQRMSEQYSWKARAIVTFMLHPLFCKLGGAAAPGCKL